MPEFRTLSSENPSVTNPCRPQKFTRGCPLSPCAKLSSRRAARRCEARRCQERNFWRRRVKSESPVEAELKKFVVANHRYENFIPHLYRKTRALLKSQAGNEQSQFLRELLGICVLLRE